MAIKIFCHQCETFIKEATPQEVSKFTGMEICVGCQEKNKKMFDEVEQLKRAAIDDIKKKASEWQVKLDETLRRALK